jgi:hypothetical protein
VEERPQKKMHRHHHQIQQQLPKHWKKQQSKQVANQVHRVHHLAFQCRVFGLPDVRQRHNYHQPCMVCLLPERVVVAAVVVATVVVAAAIRFHMEVWQLQRKKTRLLLS